MGHGFIMGRGFILGRGFIMGHGFTMGRGLGCRIEDEYLIYNSMKWF